MERVRSSFECASNRSACRADAREPLESHPCRPEPSSKVLRTTSGAATARRLDSRLALPGCAPISRWRSLLPTRISRASSTASSSWAEHRSIYSISGRRSLSGHGELDQTMRQLVESKPRSDDHPRAQIRAGAPRCRQSSRGRATVFEEGRRDPPRTWRRRAADRSLARLLRGPAPTASDCGVTPAAKLRSHLESDQRMRSQTGSLAPFTESNRSMLRADARLTPASRAQLADPPHVLPRNRSAPLILATRVRSVPGGRFALRRS